MRFILLAFFFVFGSIIGSFLNVVVLRYGARKLSGRSLCFSCGKTLRWFELFPLLSFFAQRGRCRGCKTHISWQYPLVEFIAGVVFASVFWKESSIFFSFSYLSTIYYLLSTILWSLLIALSAYDIKHKIIPNALVYTACLTSLLLFFVSCSVFHVLFLFDFLSGFLFAVPFALLWFFSKGRAIGLGDAKLVILFPWLLGLARGLSALIIGFWIGAAVALFALLLKAVVSSLPKEQCPSLCEKLKRVGMKTELPLGPFLVLGLFLVYVFGWDVTGLSLLIQ